MKKKLKEIRIEQRKTIREVAEDLSMNASVLSLKESGKRGWSLEEFVRLCNYFNVPLDSVDPQIN